MIVQDVIQEIELWAPLAYAEDFDNVGLLVGDHKKKVSGILITLDCLENVVDEAIEQDCNLIVSFHPIIFSGLKKITGKNYVERVVMKAIKNDIAIYAIHTALDNTFTGVNHAICDRLQLQNREILVPQQHSIKKLVTYVPKDNAAELRAKLFEAGGGNIGNYEECSFNMEGQGTFKGNENSNPVLGEKGKLHYEGETQINITYPKHVENSLLKSLQTNHPYEEVAYEITSLENNHQHIGIGMIGQLPEKMEEQAFLTLVKEKFATGCIRHSAFRNKPIEKVAVLGGSGAFAISNALQKEADVFLTADLKYHDFFQAENRILLADIGHYESEQYTKKAIHSYLIKKICNFANVLPASRLIISKTSTNPIQYF